MEKHTIPNPFFYEIKLSTAERIRGMVLGIVLFPLRMFMLFLCGLLVWVFMKLRMAGLSSEERQKPIRGWRRWLYQDVCVLLARGLFFCMGILWVKVKGRRASAAEVPIFVVAPHTSFLDILVFPFADMPAAVSRIENTSVPVIGAMLQFTQSVLVNRKDPESRKKCINEITARLTSNGYWHQVLMFPEGTTTNGQALIKFKPGAFAAGMPVQPVLMRYPNKLDTVRWASAGTTWFQCLWHTTTQFYTNATIEFLPVYTPSQKEKEDPNLYADNVRKLMAKALGVPVSDYVMEGRFPVKHVGGLSLPLESPARETLKHLRHAGLSIPRVHAVLSRMIDSCPSGQEKMASLDQLQQWLQLSKKKTAAKICSLFSKDDSVDLRLICVSVPAVAGFCSLEDLLTTAFRLYDSDGDGVLTAVDLAGLMGALVGTPQLQTAQIYSELTSRGQANNEELIRLLTKDPTYQELVTEYLQPEGAEQRTANEGDSSHNRTVQNSNMTSNKKAD